MSKPAGRAPLSQQRRHDRIEAARRERAEFLAGLDPLLRKYLVHPESLTLDEARQTWFQVSPQRENQRKAAVLENERLLIQIPDEWRRHLSHQIPGYKVIAEYIHSSRVRHRGAPRKSRHDRESVLVAERVAEAEQRLREGCELRCQRKAAGGAASDDTEIRRALQAIEYNDEECRAILFSKSPLGAAVILVARERRQKTTSIRSSLARARQSDPQQG